MSTVTLGRTGITTNKNGFGALPIQRISEEEAVYLLRKAYENGITFFDTARWYTDSEHKVGMAFAGMRDRLFIATKTGAQDAAGFWKDLETSLAQLQTDYIDLYQFHNPMTAASMMRRLKRRRRGRYGISVSRTIALRWLMRRSTAACMRRCSFRSVIWRQRRISSWWRSAEKRIWDLSP